MAGFMNFVLGGAADRLVPVLQTPVEDIIYEVLDQKGLPTRSEVRDLRNKLDRLEKNVAELSAALDALRGELARTAEAAERAVAAAHEAAAPPAAAAAPAPEAPPPAPAAARAPAPSPAPAADDGMEAAAGTEAGACRVDGCPAAVRARGFCAKHYQKWKRGTLVGFISPDGITTHDEVVYRVGAEFAGEVVETRYEGDEVIFLLPRAGGRSVRLKVNEARID